MDGVEVKRSSKKARLWPSARRKKPGPRRGKENESPNNRSNAAKARERSISINSMPEDLDFDRKLTTSTSSNNSSLCLETDQNYIDEEIDEIAGRRIFNVQYLFEQMAAIDHTPFNCTLKDLRFVAERRSGFQSTFIFTCKMCGTKEKFCNEIANSNINQNIVQAVVCSGSGFSQLEEFSAHLFYINYSLRGSYESRCYAAAAKHNTGSLLKTLYQTEVDKQRTFSKSYEERCRKQLRRKPNENRRRKRTIRSMEPDESYGDLEIEADLGADIFDQKKAQFLKSLQKAPNELKQIERETIGQATNPKWVKERKLRLTASIFGQVCKMRSSTSCESTIKTILYSCFKGSDATRYGNRNEPIAIKETEELLGVQIEPCGLFVDQISPFLGASPDGIIGHDTIIEIKCPAVAANMTPQGAILQKKIRFCTLNNTESRQITLKRNHNYFYQVQGQLNIKKRKYCYFVVWTPSGILYEKIERDDKFWECNLNKLQCFYMECVLPEIVDPCLPSKLPIRDRTR